MFSGSTMLSDNKETKLGSSNQQASLSAGKNIGIVLVSCCSWKFIPTAISGGVEISEVPGCHLLTDEFSVRVTKITSRIGFS